MPESRWVAECLQVPVLKAFNAITVGSLAARDLGIIALMTALGKAEHSRMTEDRREAVAGAKRAVAAAGSLALAMAGAGKPANPIRLPANP